MSDKIKTCKKCLLNESIDGVTIGEDNICNYCHDFKAFEPIGEQTLLGILNWAKAKNQKYDALVPLSGGKDSTYVLYLAVKKYKLKVLTYTFDNGLMSDLARKNIETSIEAAKVKHVWVKPEGELIKKLYRTALTQSGEICGVCGMGIERSTLKVSEDYQTPIILLGHSPTENASFTKEDLYDQKRMKTILKNGENISDEMINELLIFPNMNFISSFVQTKMGKFGKKVNILYYNELPSDKEIGAIITKELNWEDSEESSYTRHFDCLAEPFTNYIREKRFGVARRLPQLSNMIRNGEISREEAVKINAEDQAQKLPANYNLIKETFKLSDKDIDDAGKIPLNIYKGNTSFANRIFAFTRKLFNKEN